MSWRFTDANDLNIYSEIDLQPAEVTLHQDPVQVSLKTLPEAQQSLKHELSLLCLWNMHAENRKYQDDTHPGDPGIFNSLLNIFKLNFLLNPNPLPWRLFCNCRKWSTDWTLVSFASKVFKLSDRNTEKGKGNFPAIPRIAQFPTGK